MQHSDSIKALAAALSKAQAEIENADKNATNPHFRSSYADLAEIINTVRPVLTRHGLAVAQFPGYADGVVSVETILTHESGEWMSGVSAAPCTKADPQGVGSAITYLRRYSLAAVCGIAQEDDDGNAAAEQERPAQRAPQRRANGTPELCTKGQAELIRKMIQSHVITDDERDPVLAKLDAGTLTKQKASECIEWLKKEIPARKDVEKADREEVGV